MPVRYTLSSLIPEPFTFCDDSLGGDGAPHDVMTPIMLGAQALERLGRLQEEHRALSAHGDTLAIETAAQRYDALLSAMFEILIPSLPKERLSAIPYGIKADFLRFWEREVKRMEEERQKKSPPSPTEGRRQTQRRR